MNAVGKEDKTMNSFGKTMSITELLSMASETEEQQAPSVETTELEKEDESLPPKEEAAAGSEKVSRKEPSKRKAKKRPLPSEVKQRLGSDHNPVAEWIDQVERSKDFVLCRVPRDVQVVLHFISCQMQVPQWATLGYVIEDWIKNNYPEFMKWTETGKNV